MSDKIQTSPAKVIRDHCLDCMGGSREEVKRCTAEKSCKLFPWRLGKNPYRKKKEYTDEELAELRERGRKLAESRFSDE